MINNTEKLTNNTTRQADFSHMPPEKVEAFIRLTLKESLTAEESRELSEIEGQIRYKLSTRAPVEPQATRGEHESVMDYLGRVLTGD